MNKKIHPQTDGIRESIECALLGLLQKQPSHGYDLYTRFSDDHGLNRVYGMKRSLLYAHLSEMRNRGQVESEKEWGAGDRARIVYRVTEEGRSRYLAWLETPVHHARDIRNSFLLKLYCLENLESKDKNSLCRRQLEVCRKWLRKNEESRADDRFISLVQDYRNHYIRAIMEWLRRQTGDAM